MPRTKQLTARPQWALEKLEKLGGAQAQTGLSYRQICKKAGIGYDTFVSHKRNLGMMRFWEYYAFLEECERLIGGKS